MTTPPITLGAEHRIRAARLAGFRIVLVVALFSATGTLHGVVFDTPGVVKYAVLVACAVYLLIIICAPQPVLTMAVVALVFAPFAAAAKFAGLPITLGLLALLPAVLTQMINRSSPWQDVRARRSSLAVAVPCLIASLTIPLLHSARPFLPAITIVSAVAAGWLVCSLARSDNSRNWLLAGMIGGASVQAALAIYEFITDTPINLYGFSAVYESSYFFSYASGQSATVYRPSAAMPDPISLGNLLAVTVPLVLVLFFLTTSRKIRLLLAVAAVVNLIGLAVTFSRMSWIGTLVGVVVAIALLPRKQIIAASAIVAALCVPAVAFAMSLSGEALSGRFSSALDPTATTTESRQEDLLRIAIWQTTLDVAGDNPYQGVGLGNLPPYLVASVPDATESMHAHSTYLSFAAEAGSIGLLGVLFTVLSAGRDGFRGFKRNRRLYAGVIGAIAAMLVVWSTDYTIRSSTVAVMFGAIIGLAATGSRPVESA